MRMRKSASLPLVAASFVLGSMPAVAADISIEPRIAAGLSYYSFELDGEVVVGANSVDEIEFSDVLPFVGGGTTIAFDRVFVDISGQYSFNGREDLGLDVDAGGIAVDNLEQDVDFDRIEAAIAVGYRVTEQFAGYVGYRYAFADFDGSGALSGVPVNFSTELEQQGPLVGVSFVIPETILNGALVINGAVTFLDGDVETELNAQAPLADIAFDIDGDAIGLNGGLSWATPLTDHLRLVIGGDVSSYSFDDNNTSSDFREVIARLRAELRYSFESSALFGN